MKKITLLKFTDPLIPNQRQKLNNAASEISYRTGLLHNPKRHLLHCDRRVAWQVRERRRVRSSDPKGLGLSFGGDVRSSD